MKVPPQGKHRGPSPRQEAIKVVRLGETGEREKTDFPSLSTPDVYEETTST